MDIWAVQILNGISYGMLLFLLAAGLSLTFGLLRITNLTHGSCYLLGGYVGLTVAGLTGSFVLALLAGSAVVGLLAALAQRFLLRRLPRDEMAQVLVTLGLLFVIGDLALWAWGGSTQTIPKPVLLSGSLPVGRLMFPVYRLFLMGAGAVAALGLWWLQDGTRLGARMQAAVDDAEIAQTIEVNVPRLMTGVFALGAALAAAAGVLGGPLLGLFPGADFEVLVLAFVVVVVGGLGSLGGAFVGAMVVGLLDTFARVFVPELSYFAIFAPMAIILLLRPGGLVRR